MERRGGSANRSKSCSRMRFANTTASLMPCMVADPTRWSRDNRASETGLEILRNGGISFFVQTKEYDLFDPRDRFFLSLSTTIGAFNAMEQKQKSLLNRIHRAERGIPSAGKLPFGRIWDKKTLTWSVDPQKKAMIVDVARRYLKGEQLYPIARDITLTIGICSKYCGTVAARPGM